MIVWDHSIFHLQTTGGISNWWQNHCRLLSKKLKGCIASVSYCPNMMHLEEDLGSRHTIVDVAPPGRYWYVGNVNTPIGTRLFHSSYFRVPNHAKFQLLTYHDASMLRYGGIRSFAHKFMHWRCLKNSALIHCVSRHTQRELLANFPWLSPEQTRVVYHGYLPTEPCAVSPHGVPNEPFVLFVGNRGGYKRGNLAISAISRIEKVSLLFVGGGPLTNNERDLIKRLKVSHRIHQLSGLNSQQLSWLYKNAVCLWYPSSNEGFGFPVLEAAYHGCPIIAASGHSVEEISSGYSVLSPTPTPEWIASMTLDVWRFPHSSRLELGRSLVDKFSWNNYGDEMMKIYRELGAE